MKLRLFLSLIVILISLNKASAQNINEKQIAETLSVIPKLIQKKYVFIDKGKEISIKFQKIIDSKKYNSVHTADSLAKKISQDLKEISNDGHMYVVVKKNDIKNQEKSWEEIERLNEINQNYGFTSVQILKNNIGYIKIIEFMHPKRSMQTAIAAMKMVENTDKLIIDLRGNGGGYSGIAEYLLNHYFHGPPILLSKTYSSDKTQTPKTTFTSDLIYGKLMINKPLYILIDRKTASAAEYFAYTAQAFRKAKILGENSAGAAHMNEYFELPNNFKISISVSAPIVNETNMNWEGKGVIPDKIIERNETLENILDFINKQG